MLNEIFITVQDHQVTGRCTYALFDLLTIAFYICGGEDYVDMSEFAYYRKRDFGLLADRPDRSPSPDTFELTSAVNPDEIERCLVEHGQIFLDTLAEKQVAIWFIR